MDVDALIQTHNAMFQSAMTGSTLRRMVALGEREGALRVAGDEPTMHMLITLVNRWERIMNGGGLSLEDTLAQLIREGWAGRLINISTKRFTHN